MTANTFANGLIVVDARCDIPDLCGMAGLALVAGRRMSGRLADRGCTIVTTLTRADDLRVINLYNRYPGRSAMTCRTVYRCRCREKTGAARHGCPWS